MYVQRGELLLGAMGFEHDDSKWPIVKLRWVGTVTDQEVTEGLVRVAAYLNRGQRFGFLIDGRGGGGLSPLAAEAWLIGMLGAPAARAVAGPVKPRAPPLRRAPLLAIREQTRRS